MEKLKKYIKNSGATRRKLIIVSCWIVSVDVLFFGKLDIRNTFIYPIAEHVANNILPIIVLLCIAGFLGFTYKNKHTYYSLYLSVGSVLMCTVSTSLVITTDYISEPCYPIILTGIFSAAFLVLYFYNDYCDIVKAKPMGLKPNPFAPISRYDELYKSRQHQAHRLIGIIVSKESDHGCSVCVSGEWGSGKTSFVNAVLDKISSECEKSKLRISDIEEIRINAMELDDLSALVNYFFRRMKNILKENGIYSGVNSEYQELLGSLTGTVITETVGGFIKSKLSSDSNYRESLSNISQLLGTQLSDKKIIVVVDDLERCSEEKARLFLYFIKEIAMLNRCVIIFILDCNKLTERTGFDNEFLEKFFSYKINLQSVNENEIIVKSINDDTFLSLLDSSKEVLHNNITNDPERHKEHKELSVNKAQQDYDQFIKEIQNPRRLIKAFENYKYLSGIVDGPLQEKDCRIFLEKVDYKKQIFILSMLYGFSAARYEDIEVNGIEPYFDRMSSDNPENGVDVFDVLVHEEWGHHRSGYISGEIKRFLHWLLLAPDDLPKIANGFTSIQEEYISLIKDGKKPEGASLVNVLSELFSGRFSSEAEKTKVFTQAVKLYSDGMSLDEAIQTINSNNLTGYIINEDGFLKVFYEAFNGKKIDDKDTCKDIFIRFARSYLHGKLNYITSYLYLLDNKDANFRYISEAVFEKNDCLLMIQAYYKKLCERFGLITSQCENAADYLNDLLEKAAEYCNKNNISECGDVVIISDKAEKAAESVKYLLEIEKYIDSYVETRVRNKLTGNNYSEKLDSAIKLMDENKSAAYFSIDSLLKEIMFSDTAISEDVPEKINNIINAWCEKFGEPNVFWRKMYIKIKSKNT